MSYCFQKLISFNFGFATDELYLGHKVDSNFEIKIHKLIRGWMSNFYCPKRIEKIDFENPQGTKLEINDSLILDFFIDCHCPTPYSLYSDKINKIKNLILSKNEKSFIFFEPKKVANGIFQLSGCVHVRAKA